MKNKISWEEHDRLREYARTQMSEKRYKHTLGVERESEKLADIFKCEPELVKKIKSAAILHDISKELGQSELCERYKIKLGEDDARVEKGLHAKTGAYIARHEFGAGDIIFSAVYNHTYGAAYEQFDLAGKIIYLADYIEPGRKHKDCVELREYFYKNMDLDASILFAMNQTLEILLRENLYIHGDTVRNRNSFIDIYQ